MSHDQELLDIIKQSNSTDLQLLVTAKEEAKRRVLEDPNPQNLKAFDRASAMLKEYLTPKGEAPFRNRLEVLDYLKNEGYKIGQSKLYDDCKKGILPVEKDGTVTREAVENYIKYYLIQESDEELNKERAKAQLRRDTAQAEHWELKTRLEKESFIPRADYERELAAKAILIKSGLENIARGNAAEIVALVEGNPDRTIDLMEYLVARFAEYLDQYAQEREFKVVLADDDEEDEE